MSNVWVEVENSKGEVKVIGDQEFVEVRVCGKVDGEPLHMHTLKVSWDGEMPNVHNTEECDMEVVLADAAAIRESEGVVDGVVEE